jgi:predicted ATP-dependent serine protease
MKPLQPLNSENSSAALAERRSDKRIEARNYAKPNGTQTGISIRSPGEILDMPRPQDLNFLGDRVFAKGQSLVIAGCSGIGKSRLLFQLAVASIIGRPWCGLETHAGGQRWLIIQTENANSRLQDDFQQLKKWAGEDWPLVEENLFIHTLEPTMIFCSI